VTDANVISKNAQHIGT